MTYHRHQRGKQFSLIETWEDLVHAGDKVKGQSVTVNKPTAATDSTTVLPKIVSKETTRQEHGDFPMGGSTEHHHKSHR